MAGTHDFEVKQGDTFNEPLTWYDENEEVVPVSVWTAHMQVRDTDTDETLILDFSTESDDPSITLEDDKPNIVLRAERSTMADVAAGSYKYDLKLINASDEEQTLLQGKFKVKAQVTRDEEDE